MWCLETILAINQKLAEGKSLTTAHTEVGIGKAVEPANSSVQKDDETVVFQDD